MRTNQSIYREIAEHLFKQGKQAKSFTLGASSFPGTAAICVYLNENGEQCAAGKLIPKPIYDKRLEGNTIDQIIEAVEMADEGDHDHIAPEITQEHIVLFRDLLKAVPEFEGRMPLIRDLQDIHDNDNHWLSTKTMQLALINVAATYELNASFIQKLKFKDR